MDIRKLVENFTNWNLEEIEIYRELISTRDDKAIFPPYIPFVGKSYEQFGILIYAKAQNIALGDRYYEYLKNMTTEQRVRRLYDATTYPDVAIAPYNSGVIPALIGIYLYAKHHIRLESFDEIQNCLAVANYYKFSLNKNGRDINPDSLGRLSNPMQYRELNSKLCKHELNFLRPRTIVTFKGWHNKFLRDNGYKIVEISDPSFILQGGWGHFRKGGSYYKAADSVKDRTAMELAAAYSEKCEGNYKVKNKIDSVRIYLLKYYQDWQA